MNRIRAVRALHRSRSDARDRAYSGYLAALTVLVVVLPVLRALVLLAGDPAPVLAGLEVPAVVGVVAGLLLPAAVLLGRVRGPAVDEPHPTAVLLATDLPRRLVLRRPVASSSAAVVLAGTAAAVLIAVATESSLPLAAVGGAAGGAVLAVAWLAGECLPPRWSAGLAAVTALAVLLPVGPAAVVPAALTGSDLSAVIAPRRVRRPRPRNGATPARRRARAARARPVPGSGARRATGGAIGEVADALEGYRARPRRLRALSAVRIAPFRPSPCRS
ncbi:hypothetical protein B0T42_16930, partial [Rathayibacter sp. VKM Ac-2630]